MADPVTGEIGAINYTPDSSCFGLFGSRGTLVPDNMCVLHLAIGEAF
jgi:hypothetical protein